MLPLSLPALSTLTIFTFVNKMCIRDRCIPAPLGQGFFPMLVIGK